MTRTSTTLLWFSLTLFVSLGLYHTSYRVEELGRNLRALNNEIEAEQRNLHVLKAEWVYLSNPARIEAAARKHLAGLQPTPPQQVTHLGRFASFIPAKGEATSHYAAAKASKIMTASAQQAIPHPVAAKPRTTAEEAGRLNTHLVIGQAAHTHILPNGPESRTGEDPILALAGTDTIP